MTSLGADPNISAPLAPFAADGVPGVAALGRELAALAPAIQRVAVPASADGSFLARLEATCAEYWFVSRRLTRNLRHRAMTRSR